MKSVHVQAVTIKLSDNANEQYNSNSFLCMCLQMEEHKYLEMMLTLE